MGGEALTSRESPAAPAYTVRDGRRGGRDGNIWFSEAPAGQLKIARITMAGSFAEFTVPTAEFQSGGVAPGADGNMWFTEDNASKIAKIGALPAVPRVSPAPVTGTITDVPLPTAGSVLAGITPGPDGNLWFAEEAGRIGRITPSGALTEFSVPTANSTPNFITAGPDANLWFTEYGGNNIARVTRSGTFTEFAIPTAGSNPNGIIAGPDGDP